jgi:hypothetical protein
MEIPVFKALEAYTKNPFREGNRNLYDSTLSDIYRNRVREIYINIISIQACVNHFCENRLKFSHLNVSCVFSQLYSQIPNWGLCHGFGAIYFLHLYDFSNLTPKNNENYRR